MSGSRCAGGSTPAPVTIRPADCTDAPFLVEMLVAAVCWRSDDPDGTAEQVMSQPALAHYLTGWPRAEDLGVVAVDRQDPVGAAWLRPLPASDPGYGFVDADTPELAMAVLPRWRGRGVGTRLLDALVDAARQHGLPGISLSVQQDNRARRLYERAGFRPVGRVDDAFTMVLRL